MQISSHQPLIRRGRPAGLLIGLLMLGLSCSGPEATDSEAERTYHVQLDMTRDKTEADRILGEALDWWTQHADSMATPPETASDASPIRMVWRAPLYRIRLGPFATRKQAEDALSTVRPTFPDAFIAPERIPDSPSR